MRDHTLVNGRNYFNEKSLKEMCERLENGETISIYIDCIGHTRTQSETAAYVRALKERYGDRLQADDKTAFNTLYSLKGAQNNERT